MALSLPNFQNSVARAGTSSRARSFQTTLSTAGVEAIRRGTTIPVCAGKPGQPMIARPGTLVRHSAFSQQGITLIEVLVSLLILCGGLLSVAGLQTMSLRNNQSAYFRTLATNFANDMADSMRANMVAVDNAGYNNATGASNPNCFTRAGCSPIDMAEQDISDRETLVAAELPGGASIICLDSTAEDGTTVSPACDGQGSIYAIKIWWDDNRDGNSSQRFVISFRP